jgi:flagellar protein FlbD
VIKLSRIHGNGSIVVNADLIETIEACPDTTITLMTKRKFVVADSLEDVIDAVVAFRNRVHGEIRVTTQNVALEVVEESREEAA